MLKSDLKKIQRLARINAEKSRKEQEEGDKPNKSNPRKAEKKRIDDSLRAGEARKIFREGKKNDN